jgi:FkbM family methyltransferase
MPEKTTFIDRVLVHQTRMGGLHHPGAMMDAPLRYLEFYLSRYFSDGRELRSAQTGCGSSTLIFRQYSPDHRVYTVDDRSKGRKQSSRALAESYRGKVRHEAFFVPGPPTQALFLDPPPLSLDIVLIDGPHAFPGPEIAFAALGPLLVPGGILALDDITIPTIAHLFEVLCVDDRFVLHEVVNTTAFFVRTEAPFPRTDDDGWWQQRFNVQQFPALNLEQYSVGFELPIRISYEGFHSRLESHFFRGFMLADARPVTEGNHSQLRIPVANSSNRRLRVEIEVEFAVRCDAAMLDLKISAHGTSGTNLQLRTGERGSLGIEFQSGDSNTIVLDLVQTAQDAGSQGHQPDPGVFGRQGVRFVAITMTAAERSNEEVVVTRRHDGTIVSFEQMGSSFRFFVDDPGEGIQAHHARGSLYEVTELSLLSELLERFDVRRPRVLDIGANIGNHAVFFAKVLQSPRVIAFEPQARTGQLLAINCRLNEASAVDLSFLGVALGEEYGRGAIRIPQAFNLGGAVVDHNPEGSVVIQRGDDLLAGEEVDLIKIDVEGMELEVLRGLRELIQRCRPVLWVEVWDHLRTEFDVFAEELGYQVVGEYRRYEIATNLFLVERSLSV